MGYVPCQSWGVTYDLCHALHTGTIFPELHKPFCGKGGKCR
ncbi:spore coat associated protein CotJA [Parablautia sp. Marseille-Q6255]|nr:spore coat associated protein CotJA [Parablautia sp. Marseille-Q6255]